LRAEGFDASEDGTGRGTPLIPIAYTLHGSDGTCSTATATAGSIRTKPPGSIENSSTTIALSLSPAFGFAQNQRDEVRTTDVAGALASEPGMKQTTYVAEPARSLAIRGRDGTPQAELGDDKANAILTPTGGRAGVGVGAFLQAMQVRRLTPRECERLQGFPDDYTLVQHRNKPAADGPRYKALGNSMAVPVMRWIGERIQMVDWLLKECEGIE
jgi:DNA (cytosine-5)-methyltransferase 1